MRCNSEVIVSVAGSGKTTSIVRGVESESDNKFALVTYTNVGCDNLRNIHAAIGASSQRRVRVQSWYSFLLNHFIRPYQNFLYDKRVSGICFERIPRSLLVFSKRNIPRYYFAKPGVLWVDRVSEFACEVIRASGGKSVSRISSIYDKVVIDEAQDLAGWDLELIDHLLRSSISMKLVGDHRQATFVTNSNQKNKKYRGVNILKKFYEWEREGLVSLNVSETSYRCAPEICQFVVGMFSGSMSMASSNSNRTDHDGVFFLREADVASYMSKFNPKVLRFNRSFETDLPSPLNFGESKGLTFGRVLIIPHGPLLKYLRTGVPGDLEKSVEKVYVAVTRARQSVSFIVPDGFTSSVLPIVTHGGY